MWPYTQRRRICWQVRDETPKANHPIESILSWRAEPELPPLDGKATKKLPITILLGVSFLPPMYSVQRWCRIPPLAKQKYFRTKIKARKVYYYAPIAIVYSIGLTLGLTSSL
ncbi:Hat family dimerization protein [Fusarium oxysporum f. sp. albedinis]|nr:Hat family dimerization protein [Fusarium oxysporum f. sp. albedinis]